MSKHVSSIMVALALVGLVAGCGKSPTTQYDAGKTALENARIAEAEQYAPELFKKATDSLNAALVEMQKQDSRFAAFRSYGTAEKAIAEAQQLAEQAGLEAATEKERVRLADSALIVEIDSLISETKKNVAAAPRGKGSRVDLKVMQADLDAASTALATATEEFQSGSYLAAQAKLQAVRAQVVKVKSEIEAAIARVTKK